MQCFRLNWLCATLPANIVTRQKQILLSLPRVLDSSICLPSRRPSRVNPSTHTSTHTFTQPPPSPASDNLRYTLDQTAMRRCPISVITAAVVVADVVLQHARQRAKCNCLRLHRLVILNRIGASSPERLSVICHHPIDFSNRHSNAAALKAQR